MIRKSSAAIGAILLAVIIATLSVAGTLIFISHRASVMVFDDDGNTLAATLPFVYCLNHKTP